MRFSSVVMVASRAWDPSTWTEGVLDIDGGDDGGGHAGGVAGCLGGVGVEQLLEGAGGRAGVVGKCIGDLGAAVTEFGSGAAGSTMEMPTPKGANSRATDSVDPSMPHLVAWYIELPGKANLASVARQLDDVAQYRRCACAVERRG